MKKKVIYLVQITLLIIFVVNIINNHHTKKIIDLCDSLFEAKYIEITINDKNIVLNNEQIEIFKERSLYPKWVTQYKNEYIFDDRINGNIVFKDKTIIASFTLKKLENYNQVKESKDFNFNEEYIAIMDKEFYFFRRLTEIISDQIDANTMEQSATEDCGNVM